MATNLQKQLELCVGALDSEGVFQITKIVKDERGFDRWLVHVVCVPLPGVHIEVAVDVDAEAHHIHLAIPFELDGYVPEAKSRCLEVANGFNSDSSHISTIVLMQAGAGMKGIARISFAYHPFYLTEEVLEDMTGFFKSNILAITLDCTNVTVAMHAAIEVHDQRPS